MPVVDIQLVRAPAARPAAPALDPRKERDVCGEVRVCTLCTSPWMVINVMNVTDKSSSRQSIQHADIRAATKSLLCPSCCVLSLCSSLSGAVPSSRSRRRRLRRRRYESRAHVRPVACACVCGVGCVISKTKNDVPVCHTRVPMVRTIYGT